MILERVKSKKSGVFFVDGLGGTCKTFLYHTLLDNLRSRGMVTLSITTLGVAVIIMLGGRTTHSRFDILLIPIETSMFSTSKQSAKVELIRRESLLIWDEAPMAKKFAIESINRTLNDI